MPINDPSSHKRIRRRRRWFQFSLSTLLLFTTAVSVLMSWVAVKRNAAAKEKVAAEELKRYTHGSVIRDRDYTPGWVAQLLGRDFSPVVRVSLDRNADQFMDADPERNWGLLKALPSLRTLDVFYAPEFIDELGDYVDVWQPRDKREHPRLRFHSVLTRTKRGAVQSLSELRTLFLTGIRIDDVTFLRGLHKLEELRLSETGVGDDVLDAIQGCPQLSHLWLDYDDITDAGFSKLRSLRNLEELRVEYTYLTDAGLKALQELKNLKYLEVKGTAVSKKAIDEMRHASPDMTIISNFDLPFGGLKSPSPAAQEENQRHNDGGAEKRTGPIR